jgi:hypothetical protein
VKPEKLISFFIWKVTKKYRAVPAESYDIQEKLIKNPEDINFSPRRCSMKPVNIFEKKKGN